MKSGDHDLKRGLGRSFGVRTSPVRPAGRWLHTNLGGSRILRDELRHIFPDNWSFFLGEIALYCFIVLVATGIFLALFFQASEAPVLYEGSYAPLAGSEISIAYDSVLQLSLDVPAGLLVRQLHHWAALVFVGALIIHMLRTFLTASYRRPRRLNWLLGVFLLLLVGMNGLFGYSLPDDLLSGTGLRIAFSITESIPFVGPALATLMFGGEFPSGGLIARIYPVHIFLLPAAIGGLLGAHLGLLWLQRHTQFPGPGRSERTVIGTALVPAYALRTTGYFLLTAGVCTAFAAFVQINPVWLYGPYRPWDATTAAQPDWYMGWMEGAVRMMPGWDIQIGGLGAGFVTFLTVLLVAGANDVFAFVWNWPQQTLLLILQVLTIVLPPVVAVLTYVIVRAWDRRWAPRARATRRPGPAHAAAAPEAAEGGAAGGAADS